MNLLKKIFNSIKRFLNLNQRIVLTEEFKDALEILEDTSQNVFITGKAGTGKSTLVQHFRKHTKKSVVVVAPTGISAFNVGGQTIHSFFKFAPQIINKSSINNRSASRIYSNFDTLIIDEVSMVRADLLDGIDWFLRKYGRDRNLPFGGAQIVLVGDLYQLPPVVSKEEEKIFNKLYESPYFFNSNVFKESDFKIIELTTIFRQTQDQFIQILNQIRIGQVNNQILEPLNMRVSLKDSKDHIILTTTNKYAEGINETELSKINRPLFTYQGTIEGNFPTEDRNLPSPLKLQLKKGAQVMFTKNDRGGRWINGSLGQVIDLEIDKIKVKIPTTNETVFVPIEEWENIQYESDDETEEIKTIVIGKLRQYPLRLAWAITIHKSQGLTFPKVKIHLANGTFAHGQAYVAFSRCQTLEGLILAKRVWVNDIIIDPEIIEFYKIYVNKQLT